MADESPARAPAPPKRAQKTGSLGAFLQSVPRSPSSLAVPSSPPVPSPASSATATATAAAASRIQSLPVLGSMPADRSGGSSSGIKSISSSILLDANKPRSLNRLVSRGEKEDYFMKNVISPSESQRVIQLLSVEDTSITARHHHSHMDHTHANAHAHAHTPTHHRAHHPHLHPHHHHHHLSLSPAAGRARNINNINTNNNDEGEIRHVDKIHKYAKYAALYRELGDDITNGFDEDGADFAKLAIRSSRETGVLDRLKGSLRAVQASKSFSPTPGYKSAVVRDLRDKISSKEKLITKFEQSVRLASAEGRSRNRELIERTRTQNELEARDYGPSDFHEEDAQGDQAYLQHHRRARTASAAFLRQGHRTQLVPFAIQEFLDSLTADEAAGDSLVSFAASAAASVSASAATSPREANGGGGGGVGGGEPTTTTTPPPPPPPPQLAEGSVVSIDSADGRIMSIHVPKWGLGDDKALCLAAALPACSALQSLDVSGNRLTDRSCAPILRALLQLKTLYHLNLSDNKLDDRSIEPLRQNLASDSCSIVHLHLAKSDVDDDECARFMAAMRLNRSVRVLNLSQNKIGEMEERTIVFPSFVTGGMAIAGVFTENKTLQELDLSWNCLRHNTALVFAKSLAHNNTLRYLNLSKNNIGDLAAQYLGHALRTNTTMTRLDLSYNNILPKGTMVLANAIEGPTGVMRELLLHGNCVGELGSKALLRAMRLAATHSRQLTIAFRDSNVYFQDRALFDRQEPRQGVHLLQLSNPYDFFVASTLYEMYNGKQGARFRDLKYKAPGSKVWDRVPLKRPDPTGSSNSAWSPHLAAIAAIVDVKMPPVLARVAAAQEVRDSEAVDQAETALEAMRENLLQVVMALGGQLGLALPLDVARHITSLVETLAPEQRGQIHQVFGVIFRTVFRIVDKDKSSSVDKEELAKCLALLGVSFASRPELCLDYARRMIAGVDVDGSGTLDEGELVRMLFVNYTETYPEPPLPLVDSRTGTPWLVPSEGDLSIDFVSEKLPPSLDELQSDEAVKSFSGTLESSVDPGVGKEAMIKDSVTGDMFLTCEQAEVLLAYFRNPHVDNRIARRNAVEHFTPQMTTSVEACRFLAQNMSIREIFKLRHKWGAFLPAVTGLACGHFHFNLNLDQDRKAAKRLAQLNSLFAAKARLEAPTRDTSQNADFENFRNGQLNGKALALTSTFFSELPVLPVAKLAFDFVNTSRPVPGIEPCSDDALESLIETIFSPDLGKDVGDDEGGEGGEGEDEGEGEGDEDEEEADAEAEPEAEAAEHDDEHDYDSEDEEYMKRKAEKEAAEARRRKEEDAKREHDLKHKKRPGAGLLAGLKRQEELTRIAKERMEAKLNKKTESLAAIQERQLNEAYHVQWESYLDSTRAVFKMSYAAAAKEALRAALIEEGKPADGKPSDTALASGLFKEVRNRAVSAVDTAPFLDAWRKAMRREARKQAGRETVLGAGVGAGVGAIGGPHTGGKLKSKALLRKAAKAAAATSLQDLVMVPPAERLVLIERCIGFEKSLQMLECYLIYNLWVSCSQVRAVCEAFMHRGAPDPVLVRCICTLFCRIVDLENLMPEVLDHASLALSRPFVREDVMHRLGALNVLSPVFPDGSWTFDLAAVDEREAAKLFVRLAAIEASPGAEHFVHCRYSKSVFEPHQGGVQTNAAQANAQAQAQAQAQAEPQAQAQAAGQAPAQPKDGAGFFKVPLTWADADPGGVPKFGSLEFFFKTTAESAPREPEEESHDGKKKRKKGRKHAGKKKDKDKGKDKGKGKKAPPAAAGTATGGSAEPTHDDVEGDGDDSDHENGEGEGEGEDHDDADGDGPHSPPSPTATATATGAGAATGAVEPPPVEYRPNDEARRELQLFRCLAGTHGRFVRGVQALPSTGAAASAAAAAADAGVSAGAGAGAGARAVGGGAADDNDPPDLASASVLSLSDTVAASVSVAADAEQMVAEADWAYVGAILQDLGPAAGQVLDPVGFKNFWFGPQWKPGMGAGAGAGGGAKGKDKFIL